MKQVVQTSLVHHQRFGEGERFTDKASQALSQRIVPTFHMSRFACFLTHAWFVFFATKDQSSSNSRIVEAGLDTLEKDA
jgi:hypothetical protein